MYGAAVPLAIQSTVFQGWPFFESNERVVKISP